MAERIISAEREAALVSLLDDPSPTVQAAVQAEFARLGKAGVSILQKVLRDHPETGSEHARQILAALQEPDPSRMLMEFIRSLRYDLETGLFLINHVINPKLEIGPVRDAVDALARRCREIGVAPMSAREQCKLINRVLFHEYGFRGNSEDFEDPLNSCLEAVVRRRKGIPITLSALYLLVAQRLGLELEPVGLPGHFMVGCYLQQEPFFIDPFERGRFWTLEELREWLATQHFQAEFYPVAPTPVGEVLCRVCRNLVAHFDSRQQPRWANRFRAFVREFEQTYRRSSGT